MTGTSAACVTTKGKVSFYNELFSRQAPPQEKYCSNLTFLAGEQQMLNHQLAKINQLICTNPTLHNLRKFEKIIKNVTAAK